MQISNILRSKPTSEISAVKGRIVSLAVFPDDLADTYLYFLEDQIKAAGLSSATILFPFGEGPAATYAQNSLSTESNLPQTNTLWGSLDIVDAIGEITELQKNVHLLLICGYTTHIVATQSVHVERERLPSFIKWAEDLQYHVLQLPKPSLTLLAHTTGSDQGITRALSELMANTKVVAEAEHTPVGPNAAWELVRRIILKEHIHPTHARVTE
jgi:hypothetical protein